MLTSLISRHRSSSSRRRSASKIMSASAPYDQGEALAGGRNTGQRLYLHSTAPLCVRNVETLSDAGSHLNIVRHSADSDMAAIDPEDDARSTASGVSEAEQGYNVVPMRVASNKSQQTSRPKDNSQGMQATYNTLYMALEACVSTTSLSSKLYQGPSPSLTSSNAPPRRRPSPSVDIGSYPCHPRSTAKQAHSVPAVRSTPPGSAFGDRVPKIWWAVVVGESPGIYITADAANKASGGLADARIIPFTSLSEATSAWFGAK
ncbi:hypothetical protein BDY19DRAFT_910852 [Irpex rosettiformis]|uniref:Uncharacterized protein n=1 Tax=Irpex rosettiformis TaxID=378272 RepID=A0ACB8TM48_9APHY|nr:hypothetical protein BDY19DRAFT_910852 [Irpex rosettiformis]